MNKWTLIIAFSLMTYFVNAQRFAYVNVNYIMDNIPEYIEAQEKLDEISKGWQSEVEEKRKDIENSYNNFRDREVLFTDDMRKRKEEEISMKENALNQYRKEKFGYKGELFKKRQELVKPIQDKVFESIEKLAKEKRYDFIFDKSAGVHLLYANASLDKSNEILKSMGYSKSGND